MLNFIPVVLLILLGGSFASQSVLLTALRAEPIIAGRFEAPCERVIQHTPPAARAASPFSVPTTGSATLAPAPPVSLPEAFASTGHPRDGPALLS